MPRNDLDPSWVSVLNEAFANKWKWGKDIAFTYGPFGFLILKQFHPQTWVPQFIFWIFVTFGFSFSLFKALDHLPLIIAVILVWLFTLPILYSGTTFFLVIPLIVAINYKVDKNLINNLDTYLLVILSGIGALSKYSFAPYPFILYPLIDIYAFCKVRKGPFLTILFVGTVFTAFLILNSSFKDFFAFLQLSNAFSTTYGKAMQVSGPTSEILQFLIMAILTLLGVFLLKDERNNLFKTIIVFLAFLGFFFIVQKASFVRHDSHGLTSWNTLLMGSIFYFSYGWKRFPGNGKRLYFSILLIGSFVLFLRWYNFYTHNSYLGITLTTPYYSFANNFKQLGLLVTDPQNYYKTNSKEYVNALRDISNKSDIPTLEGSVDIIPSRQIEVISKRLDYHPRPIFQSYATHAPSLIRRNRDFFNSPDAPQNLIFGLDDVDGRYPGTSEGGSWIEIFKHYDPIDLYNKNLLLKKRQRIREITLKPVGTFHLPFGSTLNLASYNSYPLWATIEFDENLLGKLIGILFKNPIIFVRTEVSPHQRSTFRMVPTISGEGQLISPLVKNSLDFASLFFERSFQLKNPVKSLRFQSSWLGKMLYSNIKVKLYHLILSDDFEHSVEGNLSRSLKSGQIIHALKVQNGTLEFLSLDDEPIAFAHAPSELKLTVPEGIKGLTLAFGIKPGAWENQGMTDGVCFKVFYNANPKKLLLNECLDPKINEDDRKEKTYEIELSTAGSNLIFSTGCNGNCYWDWSYWTKLSFIK